MQSGTVPCGGSFSFMEKPVCSRGEWDEISKKESVKEYSKAGYPKMVSTPYEIMSFSKEMVTIFSYTIAKILLSISIVGN